VSPPPRRLAPPEPAAARRPALSPAPAVAQSTEPVAAAVVGAPIAAPAPTAAPAPAPQSPPPHGVENVEASYVAKLRAYLNSIKRYPTSREARQQRPRGKVRVWLDLARDGTLRGLGIEESSGSMILDGAAQSTVRQGTYPAFPEDMWSGAGTHRFAVTLEYTLEG
jgi:protein TonB